MKKIIMLLVLLSLAFASSAPAITLKPIADTYVLQSFPTSNWSANVYLTTGYISSSGDTARSYMKFDLTSVLNSDIETAMLYLYNTTLNTITTPTINVYSASNSILINGSSVSWGESSSPAPGNFPSWNRQPIYSGTPVSAPVGNVGWYSWNVTDFAQLAAGNHFSLALIGPSSGTNMGRSFSSEEGSNAIDPYLLITAPPPPPVPEPATMLLLGLGLIGLAGTRRRFSK